MRKEHNEPEYKEKIKLRKARSFKASQRDKRHHSRVGSKVQIEGSHYLVAITTPLFVYLVKQNGNHKRVTWDSWDKLKLYNESLAAHIKWTNKVKEKIRLLKKKSAFKGKLRKRIKIKREPVIKRTPVKIKKKRHRRSR